MWRTGGLHVCISILQYRCYYTVHGPATRNGAVGSVMTKVSLLYIHMARSLACVLRPWALVFRPVEETAGQAHWCNPETRGWTNKGLTTSLNLTMAKRVWQSVGSPNNIKGQDCHGSHVFTCELYSILLHHSFC